LLQNPFAPAAHVRRWGPNRAGDGHVRYQGKARQPIPGPGLNQPMLWTTGYGQGRIFVTVLGHDAAAVSTPAFVATCTRGAEWAATGNVTLPIPPEMAQQRQERRKGRVHL